MSETNLHEWQRAKLQGMGATLHPHSASFFLGGGGGGVTKKEL